MEMLDALKQKIQDLVVIAKDLQIENQILLSDKSVLEERIMRLEDMLLRETESFQVLCKEKNETQKIVDDLISNIDSLIESGS